MDDVKKVLVQSNVFTSSSDDSDCESLSAHRSKNCNKSGPYACNEFSDVKSSKSFTTKKRNGEKRLPTRKPDPNVYNRNALLARENRRKKKIYLETIEKELEVVRKANRTLAKALRRQLNIAERLEKEKQYYENLVKAKFETLDPVNASSFRHIPQTEENTIPPVRSGEETVFEDIMDTARSRSSSLNETDQLSIVIDSLSDDLYDSTDASLPFTSTTWDNIWGDEICNVGNFISTNMTDLQNSSVDHCYAREPTESKVNSSDQESEPSDYIDVEGICPSNGNIFESCHIFPAYFTPPLQLFNKQSS